MLNFFLQPVHFKARIILVLASDNGYALNAFDIPFAGEDNSLYIFYTTGLIHYRFRGFKSHSRIKDTLALKQPLSLSLSLEFANHVIHLEWNVLFRIVFSSLHAVPSRKVALSFS